MCRHVTIIFFIVSFAHFFLTSLNVGSRYITDNFQTIFLEKHQNNLQLPAYIPGFSLSLKSPKRKHGFSEGLGDLQNELGSAAGEIDFLSERGTGSGTTRNKPMLDLESRTLSASWQLAP